MARAARSTFPTASPRICTGSAAKARSARRSRPKICRWRRNIGGWLPGWEKNWRSLALGGGEDYVLLFTLPTGEKAPAGAVAIGRVLAGRQVWLEEDGKRRPLPPLGFDHLAG